MGIGAGATAGVDPARARPGTGGRAGSQPSKTVRAIARRYAEEGLESALYEKPRRGQRRVLDAGQSQRIIALVCGPPPEGRARWSVRLLPREAVKRKLARRVGRETIRILLQSHDLKPWREKMWCVAELDPEYLRRMEDVLALYEKPLSETVGIDALFGPRREGRHFLRDCASSLIKT